MENTFSHLLQTRKNIIRILNAYRDKLHIIPEGFSNNLYWNAAHCLVTQQLLCYRLSGLSINYSDNIIDRFKKGSKTQSSPVSDQEVNWLLEELEESVKKMESDFKAGMFKNFKEYTTSFGVTLSSSEEAISFNIIHEGLHLGYMMAMRKSL